MNLIPLKFRRGKQVAPKRPLSDSADLWEGMSDRALPLYVPEDDPRVDSIAEHVDSTPGMKGVA